MDIFGFLRKVKVLEGFDDKALRRLSDKSSLEEYSTGQIIRRIGQKADNAGVVVNGCVDIDLPAVEKNAKKVTILPGQLFGIISLLTGEPSIADVIATAPTRVVMLPKDEITKEFVENPAAAQELAKLLTARLVHRSSDTEEQSIQRRASFAPGAIDSSVGSTLESPVLVLNLGSSSIKFAVFTKKRRCIDGLIEIDESKGSTIKHVGPAGNIEKQITAKNHETALLAIFDLLTHPTHGVLDRLEDLASVGHRTVHGGTKFTAATIVDEDVKKEIRRTSVLAPLHNPLNLAGIELCEKLLPPNIPNVAVFDTSFHMTMPEHAYRYALPTEFADRHQLRRFGFHGTSHKYVAQIACGFLEQPPRSLRIISCHLGNGASVAAVDHGRSIDTSMGLTPLEGLIMGTRCGDIDPGLILHLLETGMSREEIGNLLNKKSGLLGLSSLSRDMRELEQAADTGHPGALLAIQAYCYRIRKYIGSFSAAMNGLDTIVFAGGIGENSSAVRSRICTGLSFLGVELDENMNREKTSRKALAQRISSKESKISVLVIPTDEEGMIAVETTRALSRSGVSDILAARRDRPIPIGVSAHHVHVSEEHLEQLFGEGHRLTRSDELAQPGQYACKEQVDLVGPKNTLKRVRILGPERSVTQVEISRTEEFKLGIDAPIRESGNINGSPGLTIIGPKGSVEIKEGVICAFRHIHMSPENALVFGLKDKDIVRVKLGGTRSLIFGDVLIRVAPDFKLEMHIDTDEANAAEVTSGMTATIESIQRRST